MILARKMIENRDGGTDRDPARMAFEHAQALGAFQVPEPQCLVAPRHSAAAVGRERHDPNRDVAGRLAIKAFVAYEGQRRPSKLGA